MESIRQSGSKADYPPQGGGGIPSQEDINKRREIKFILAGLKRAYMNMTGKDILSEEELDALRTQAIARQKVLDRDSSKEQKALIASQNRRILETYRGAVSGRATTEGTIGIGDNPDDMAEAIRLAEIDAQNATLQRGETADDVAQKFMETSGLTAPARSGEKSKPAKPADFVKRLKRSVLGK